MPREGQERPSKSMGGLRVYGEAGRGMVLGASSRLSRGGSFKLGLVEGIWVSPLSIGLHDVVSAVTEPGCVGVSAARSMAVRRP